MKSCSISGCSGLVVALGWCSKHYYRSRRNGDPMIIVIAPKGASIADRLALYSRRAESGCLEWTGAITAQGYGKFQLGGKTRTAHRIAWFEAHGEWPPAGICVCHRCDNRLCIDTTHMFLGTSADNTADMDQKGRRVPISGERHGMRKLTADDVREIRNIYASSKPLLATIADRFGVSRSQISRIANNTNWRETA